MSSSRVWAFCSGLPSLEMVSATVEALHAAPSQRYRPAQPGQLGYRHLNVAVQQK